MASAFHLYGMPDPPALYLCEVDKEILGAIPAIDINLTRKFNDIDEITFQVPRKYTDIHGNEITNALYEKIEALRLIYIENAGYFEIQEPSIEKDAVSEYKRCTAYSLQYELTKKYLKSFYINQYNDEDIDEVDFCNDADHSHSLLHLCLEKFPQWKIGHVDGTLKPERRSFEIDEQDVYSFLTKDVAETFCCVFLFNTNTNTIEVYPEDDIGEDTSIYVTYENLANTVSVNYNADDIVTSLTILGADGLDVRNLNMGQDSVLDLSYYHTPDWMGQDLFDAWNTYLEKYNSRIDEYSELANQMDGKYLEVYELLNRQPPTKDSETWTEYGFESLTKKIKELETTNALKRELGWSDPSHSLHNKYVEEYEKIQAAKTELKLRDSEIKAVQRTIDGFQSQLDTIASDVHWKNNLTEEQQLKLTRFIREDTWQDSNFLITDEDTPQKESETRNALMKYGKKYLSKISRPQLSFSMDMKNIFALKEFEPLAGHFAVGNYIHVILREGYSFIVRLLKYSISFDDPTNFSCEFGNAARSKSEFDNHSDLLEQAVTSGKTVADWKSYWQKSASKITEIDQMIKNGLDTAVTRIHSASNRNDITIDEAGIHLRMLEEDGSYSPYEAVLTGNMLLYSDDNLKTSKTGLGQFEIEGQKFYGLLADAVLAGYIGASHLVGNEISNGNNFKVTSDGDVTARNIKILGGEITWDEVNLPNNMATKDEIPKVPSYIKSTKITATTIESPNIIGGHLLIKNSSGTVSSEITSDGRLSATGATISGNLTATGGTIGGWSISSDSISSSDVFISSNPSKYAFAAGGRNSDGSDALTRIGHDGLLYTENLFIDGGEETSIKCFIRNTSRTSQTEMYGGGFHIYETSNPSKVIKANTDSFVVEEPNHSTQMHSTYFSVTDRTDGSETIYDDKGQHVNSLSSIKTNIQTGNNLLQDVMDTDICSFNFKSNLTRSVAPDYYGFVIGEGYNITPKILSYDNKKICMYSALGVLWGGVKELAAKVTALEEKLNQITTSQLQTQPNETPTTNQEVN